jgi:hypothetical protein
MALKKMEEFGSDLEVLFVEVQGADMDRVASFSLNQKWLGRGGKWTTEAPFQTGANGIPNYALLGADGKILLMGNPLADAKKIEEAIQNEIKGKRAGSPEQPKEIEKAWKDFGKGKAAEALAAVQKLAEGSDAELASAASAALGQMRARVDGKLARAEWLVENGHYEKAAELLKVFQKELKGAGEADAKLAAVAEKLKSPDLKAEIDAEKKLLKLESALFAEGPTPQSAGQLAKFAEKNPGTKAAERAAFWAKHATVARG